MARQGHVLSGPFKQLGQGSILEELPDTFSHEQAGGFSVGLVSNDFVRCVRPGSEGMPRTVSGLHIRILILQFCCKAVVLPHLEEVWTRLQSALSDSNLSPLLLASDNRKAARK